MYVGYNRVIPKYVHICIKLYDKARFKVFKIHARMAVDAMTHMPNHRYFDLTQNLNTPNLTHTPIEMGNVWKLLFLF